MKVTEKTQYIADDGTAFDTEAECLYHEAEVAAAERVRDYISYMKEGEQPISQKWETRLGRLLLQYETHRLKSAVSQ